MNVRIPVLHEFNACRTECVMQVLMVTNLLIVLTLAPTIDVDLMGKRIVRQRIISLAEWDRRITNNMYSRTRRDFCRRRGFNMRAADHDYCVVAAFVCREIPFLLSSFITLGLIRVRIAT